jgi:hypothetical protein
MKRAMWLAAVSGALLVVASGQACAQTITVNWSQDDDVDFAMPQTVANLPGPDGHVTFAEAVIAANNTAGAQTIVFNVPQNVWWTLFGTQVCMFYHSNMHYVSGDDTTIDFTTQTAFTGDTNPNGNEVGLYYAGPPASIPNLWLAGNRITVKGADRFLGNNFEQGLWVTGNDCRVIGCTTTGLTIRGDYGAGARNQIGGSGPGEGNVFSGPVTIRSRANQNVIRGNIFRYGLRLTGDTLYGTCDDNVFGGATPAEGNVFAGKGTTGEEGLPTGTELEIYHAVNTLIQNNKVGTSNDGLSRYAVRTGVTGIGVGIGAVGTMVIDNTVSGIERTGSNRYQGVRFGVAIGVAASANRTVIRGNRIGVGIDGVTPILNVHGITVNSDPNGTPSNTTIEGNLIAHNETSGVRILNAGSGRVTRNAIRDNGGLGIDLGVIGVQPNDPLDADTGPNGLQNYPVLASATVRGGNVEVVGELRSMASRAYVVELFASVGCDASGYGEGARYLGSVHVTTDGSGVAPVAALLNAAVGAGESVTATATEVASGYTSEFSACVTATAASCAADFNGDGVVDLFDYLDFVSVFADGGAQADFNADTVVDFFDYLDFVAAFSAGC